MAAVLFLSTVQLPTRIRQTAQTELEVGRNKSSQGPFALLQVPGGCDFLLGTTQIHIWGLFSEQSTANKGAGLDINLQL